MYQNQYQQGGYGQPQGNANYGTNGSYGANGQNAGTNGTGNVYVGSAKFQQGQYGLMVSVSLNAEDIAKLQANLNANGWVTFSLRERQQPSQSGATHYGVIRPPMDNQGGSANWNGPVGQVGPVGQRGNQWNGARGQGYQQPAPPPQQQQGYDNGGFNQAPAPTQYQQPTPPPPPAQQYQQPAPAAPGNEHRYGPADAQPPAADDG